MRDGIKEEPETDHGGEDAQNEYGGAALVQVPPSGLPRIEIRLGDPAKPHARAEDGHEQQRDADDDPDIKHSDSTLSAAEFERAGY